MALTQRVLRLILLTLVGLLLAPHVLAQYIHAGWQPGLPKVGSASQAKKNYRKGAGWQPDGTIIRDPDAKPAARKAPAAVPAKSAPVVPKAPRAPRTETTSEKLFRFGLTRVLRWSDEQVDETQDRMRAKSNPTFHPRIENLSNTSNSIPIFLDRIGYDGKDTLDDGSVLAGLVNSVTGSLGPVNEPWAILFSSSATDKESQRYDAVWNRTVHALYPDPSTGFAPIIKGSDDPEAVKQAEAAKAKATAAPSLPEGFEVIGGFTVQVAQPTATPGLGASQRKGLIGHAFSYGKDYLLGGSGSAEGISAEDQDALAESEMTGKEILSPSQWGTRQALVETYKGGIDDEGLRFGYANYLKHQAIEWAWGVWKVPVVVFVTPSPPGSKRPYDLRYWKVHAKLPSVDETIQFLGTGSWKDLPVWNTEWAPGGTKSPPLFRIGKFLGKWWYPWVEILPGWLMMIVSTSFASFLPQLLHRSDKKKLKEVDEAKKRRKAVEEAVKQSVAAEVKEREEKEAAVQAELAAQSASASGIATSSTSHTPSKGRNQRNKRGGRR